MSDAVITAILVAATNALTGFGTFYGTRASLKKLKSDEAQSLNTLLMNERREREADIRALRSEIKQLQDERESVAEQAHAMFELDRRIRHDSATLIRNLLSRAHEAGMNWPDLIERNRELETLREKRRGMTA